MMKDPQILKVSNNFSELIRQNYEDFNRIIYEKTGKTMTFIDYTETLSKLSTMNTPIFINIQPIKKGRNAKTVTLDITELL